MDVELGVVGREKSLLVLNKDCAQRALQKLVERGRLG